jgi:hypothetical protein
MIEHNGSEIWIFEDGYLERYSDEENRRGLGF